MKKLILIVIVSLLTGFLAASSSETETPSIETKTSSIQLQGAYNSALNMNITPIAAQTESYLAGMPFNIEEEFVQYQENSDGRAIANWNVLSNTRFNIYIKVENMVHADAANYAPSIPLSYILTFSYNLAFPNLTDLNGSGSFWVRSGSTMGYGTNSTTTEISIAQPYENDTSLPAGIMDEDSFYKINLFNSNIFDSGFVGFTGSVDGRVFFKFTQEATEALQTNADEYPAGNYKAMVTFFIEGVE